MCKQLLNLISVLTSLVIIACTDTDQDNCNCSFPEARDTVTFSNPSAEGMDSLKLAQAIEAASESSEIYSMIIMRNGGIVSENYFNGMSSQDSFSVRSVTKSVVGALVGIAVKQGKIKSESKKLIDYFPEHFDTVSDPLKREITIKHLLTMTSGFQWNEIADRLYGDYMESAIILPMSDKPGEVFNYNSSNPHLLSGIITKASGESTFDFAKNNLFEPLGMTVTRWDQDPQGYYLGGTGLFMTARDLARIGFLYLNHGCYSGNSIICSEWVEMATNDQLSALDTDYGYLWWIMNAGGHKVPYAYGYGGQMIYVIYDLDLVVVFTANPNVNAQTAQNTRSLEDNILISYIIPAVQQ